MLTAAHCSACRNHSLAQLYKGYICATAHAHVVEGSGALVFDGAEPAQLAAGWEVAPGGRESGTVCCRHHWQCEWLVLDDGDIYATSCNYRWKSEPRADYFQWGFPRHLSRLVRHGAGMVSAMVGSREAGPPFHYQGVDVLLRKKKT